MLNLDEYAKALVTFAEPLITSPKRNPQSDLNLEDLKVWLDDKGIAAVLGDHPIVSKYKDVSPVTFERLTRLTGRQRLEVNNDSNRISVVN